MDIPELDLAAYTVPPCAMQEDDPFRQVVTLSETDDEHVLRVKCICEVRLPKQMLEQEKADLPDPAGEVAKMIGERIHLDTWLDVVPLIKERVEETWIKNR